MRFVPPNPELPYDPPVVESQPTDRQLRHCMGRCREGEASAVNTIEEQGQPECRRFLRNRPRRRCRSATRIPPEERPTHAGFPRSGRCLAGGISVAERRELRTTSPSETGPTMTSIVFTARGRGSCRAASVRVRLLRLVAPQERRPPGPKHQLWRSETSPGRT